MPLRPYRRGQQTRAREREVVADGSSEEERDVAGGGIPLRPRRVLRHKTGSGGGKYSRGPRIRTSRLIVRIRA